MITLPILTENVAPLVGPPQGQWTYADWEKLPDDSNRYEIIDGALYMTTAPSFFHQWIVSRLARYIGIPAEDKKLGLWAVAPVGVIMPGCDPVQPDFVIVLNKHASIIHDKRIFGVPDLIVEIMSPGNAVYDAQIKLAAYERAGMPEYAIIDPKMRTLNLYTLSQPNAYGQPQLFSEKDQVSFACLTGITFDVNALFDGSPDSSL